jgi:tetratricopeptide (TPR) repeat protein
MAQPSRIVISSEIRIRPILIGAYFGPVLLGALILGFSVGDCRGSVAAVQANGQSSGQTVLAPGPSLDTAFSDMYKLKFDAARVEISAYAKIQPDDPLGYAAQAASYLFEEFEQKDIFSSAFFLDDRRFLGGVDGTLEQNRNPKFLEANQQARDIAKRHLNENAKDSEALMTLAMADGMESDYDELIEKKQLASLSMLREADSYANKALAVDPHALDAYVSLGSANYIIGCLPSYKKAFLWMGGIHGDRVKGMSQLQQAAQGGHYLRPFAKIMLALASEREHQFTRAADLLSQLVQEFPENPHFSKELTIAQHSAN